MTIVAYRLYCDECTNDVVIRESRMDDHPWKVKSKTYHSGLCPACNPSAEADGEYARQHEEVPFENLDNIGDTGAENLRDAGIITRQHVSEASDEKILNVAWVGDGGLKAIREEVQE